MTVFDGNLKRDGDGRFAPGTVPGPGRPAGVPNRTTTDLREIRHAIAGAYYTCGGRELMQRLADENPQAFIKAVVSCLPREDRLELNSSQRTLTVMVSREQSPDDALAFVRRCLEIADGEPVERQHVVAAMRQQNADQNKRLDSP